MQRRIDELGRIVLPRELQTQINLTDCDAVDISVKGNQIILEKTTKECYICGSVGDLADVGRISFCVGCRADISNLDNGETLQINKA